MGKKALQNLTKERAEMYASIWRSDGATVEMIPQNDGLWTVAVDLPESAGEEGASAGTTAAVLTESAAAGGASGGKMRRILVTESDLDALMRVANSEVGHFGKYGEAQLRGGLAAVVDTIFNRVAHDKFPNTIEEVVDQPKQFSAINATGSWTGLPRAPLSIARIVTEHVLARARGKASELDGATHFLNPYISSQSAMRQWGQHVKQNPVAVYGSDQNKDVHYHGFPPGSPRPGPYSIAYGGSETRFDGSGRAVSVFQGTSSHGDIRRRIVEICRAELACFNHGQSKETDDPQYLRVGDYWKVVGSANNGRTVNVDGKRPAWSAAFVSFVLQEAGAGNRFPYANAHCIYFQHFVGRSGPMLYEAMLANEVTPQPGDILHYGRDTARNYDFAAARSDFGDDGWYPSHCDIVVSVDVEAKIVKTIGGNVDNSVKEKTYALDDNGRLKDRVEDGQTLPWIGMLRLT